MYSESPRAEQQAGQRWRWGGKYVCCRLRQNSRVQSLVKGEFRNELFTTMLHALRVASSFQHKGLNENFRVWCEKKKATSSVCLTMVNRMSDGKCCVSADEELAGKAREVNLERLLVNSALWMYCRSYVKLQGRTPLFYYLRTAEKFTSTFCIQSWNDPLCASQR
jgi:hypothetical protein